MQTALNTSVTSDSKKGRQAVAIFRAAYDKVGLGEEEAQRLNEHPGFAAYLAAGIRRFSETGSVFPVYLEIEVGGKSRHELITELELRGNFVSDWAKDIMSKPTWKPGEQQTVKFTRVKVRDLGFTRNPKTTKIWARISKLGHSLCEPGDGPAIRIALKDQPRGDHFSCAMKQITDSDGNPSVFSVERDGDGEPWLNTDLTSPGFEWDLDDWIAFRLRK